jgi:hypothetical protein
VGARQKLNSASILGSIALSAILGCLTNSWLVFIVAAVIMVGLSCYVGDIRSGKGGDW